MWTLPSMCDSEKVFVLNEQRPAKNWDILCPTLRSGSVVAAMETVWLLEEWALNGVETLVLFKTFIKKKLFWDSNLGSWEAFYYQCWCWKESIFVCGPDANHVISRSITCSRKSILCVLKNWEYSETARRFARIENSYAETDKYQGNECKVKRTF